MESKLWFMDSAKYIADHVKDVYTHPIQDAAHCSPCAQSEGHADSLEGFLYAINKNPVEWWPKVMDALTG